MQVMNRRMFLKTSGTGLALVVVSPSLSLLLEGCSSTQDIEALINAVIAAASNIISVAEPGAPWIADMKAAIAALQQAETSWLGGAPLNILTSILNTIEIVASAIPETAAYAPLIDVVVAAIEAVLAAIPKPTTPVAAVSGIAVPQVQGGPYNHRDKVAFKVHRYLPGNPAAEFKKKFNDAAVKAGLGQAVIK